MSLSDALLPERDSHPARLLPEPVPLESRFADAAARARSLAELLDEALLVLKDEDPASLLVATPSRTFQHEAEVLSPREREVLALVAEGRTNKAIAAALFVSPNTVKTHVTSLLRKLRVDTRVQLAAIATKQGLHHRAASGVAVDPVSL
jgi:DNA-binding NarL/FixJ family response regulator